MLPPVKCAPGTPSVAGTTSNADLRWTVLNPNAGFVRWCRRAPTGPYHSLQQPFAPLRPSASLALRSKQEVKMTKRKRAGPMKSLLLVVFSLLGCPNQRNPEDPASKTHGDHRRRTFNNSCIVANSDRIRRSIYDIGDITSIDNPQGSDFRRTLGQR